MYGGGGNELSPQWATPLQQLCLLSRGWGEPDPQSRGASCRPRSQTDPGRSLSPIRLLEDLARSLELF